MKKIGSNNDLITEKKFTELHRKYSQEHVAIREAKCRLGIISEIMQPIENNELIVGGISIHKWVLRNSAAIIAD